VYIFQISPVFINKVLQRFNNIGDRILTSEKKNNRIPNQLRRERERERKRPPKNKKSQGTCT
jgi:hypothetical protein